MPLTLVELNKLRCKTNGWHYWVVSMRVMLTKRPLLLSFFVSLDEKDLVTQTLELLDDKVVISALCILYLRLQGIRVWIERSQGRRHCFSGLDRIAVETFSQSRVHLAATPTFRTCPARFRSIFVVLVSSRLRHRIHWRSAFFRSLLKTYWYGGTRCSYRDGRSSKNKLERCDWTPRLTHSTSWESGNLRRLNFPKHWHCSQAMYLQLIRLWLLFYRFQRRWGESSVEIDANIFF